MNISGGKSKINNFNSYLANSPYDLIAIQETWFDETVKDGELISNTNYNIFREDRSSTTNTRVRGGGVAILVSKDMSYENIEFNYDTLIEYVIVRIGKGNSTVIVINVYLPPYSDKQRLQMITQLESIIMSVTGSFKNIPLIIVGDFNMSNIEWFESDQPGLFPTNTSLSKYEKKFLTLMAKYGLLQCNACPNRPYFRQL